MTTPPSSPSFVSTPSKPPSIPTAPPRAGATAVAPPSNGKPAFSEHQTHGGSSPLTSTLLILILLLVAGGLPLIWLKANEIGSGTSGNASSIKSDIGTLATKVDSLNTTIGLVQSANASTKQELFNAGADVLKCADSDSKTADLLITEGTRLKAEGDAAKDQPKSQEGQWILDRGNELKANAATCTTSGTGAQTQSGIPVNK